MAFWRKLYGGRNPQVLTGISHEQEDWYGRVVKEIPEAEIVPEWKVRANDLEGKIAHLTTVVNGIKNLDKTPGIISSHMGTLAVMLQRVEHLVVDAKTVSVQFDPREIQSLVASLREFSESPRFRKLAKPARSKARRKK